MRLLKGRRCVPRLLEFMFYNVLSCKNAKGQSGNRAVGVSPGRDQAGLHLFYLIVVVASIGDANDIVDSFFV